MTEPRDDMPQPLEQAEPGRTPAGWYRVPDGRVLWWDGTTWSEPGSPSPAGWHAGQPLAVVPQPGIVPAVDPRVYQQPPYGAPQSPYGASKVTTGLLQLLPGLFLGLGGIGRVYAGANRGLGIAMLALSAVGWVVTLCSAFLFLPVLACLVLWFVIDGIVILAGHPRDDLGRPLV